MDCMEFSGLINRLGRANKASDKGITSCTKSFKNMGFIDFEDTGILLHPSSISIECKRVEKDNIVEGLTEEDEVDVKSSVSEGCRVTGEIAFKVNKQGQRNEQAAERLKNICEVFDVHEHYSKKKPEENEEHLHINCKTNPERLPSLVSTLRKIAEEAEAFE